MLKALILNQCPPPRRKELDESFRGAKAHDFEWLKARYFEVGGPSFPSMISKAFSFANTWEVNFRYRGGTIKLSDAKNFIEAVRTITEWAEERM